MQDSRKLSDLAKAEIEQLEAEGVKLTAADIVAINAAAWEVETPEARLLLSRGVPVFVGGITLWPMTIYGAEWYSRVGCRLIGSLLQTYALAYALQHGRDEGNALDIGPGKATVILMAWRARLRCRHQELVEAIAQCVEQDTQPEDPADAKQPGMTYGEFSALITARAGGSFRVWERQCSIGYVRAVLGAIIEQNKADDKPCASDPKIRAERALGWLCEMIRQRHKKAVLGGK